MTGEGKPEEDEKVAFYNSLNILKRNIKTRRRRTMDRSKIFKKIKRNDLEKVHCPWCDAAFPAGGQDLEIHVEQHLAQVNFFCFCCCCFDFVFVPFVMWSSIWFGKHFVVWSLAFEACGVGKLLLM